MDKVQLKFLHLTSSSGVQRITIHLFSNSSGHREQTESKAAFTFRSSTGEELGRELWTTCEVRSVWSAMATDSFTNCSYGLPQESGYLPGGSPCVLELSTDQCTGLELEHLPVTDILPPSPLPWLQFRLDIGPLCLRQDSYFFSGG